MLNIRAVINNNRLYAWLIIAMLFMQSFVALTHPIAYKKAAATKNFSQEIEDNKQLLQKAVQKNPQIAATFGYISLFMMAIFILGVTFFIDFLLAKKRGQDPIPKTQEECSISWGIKDVVKVVIIFLLFNYIFLTLGYLLIKSFKVISLDNRAFTVLDTVFMDISVCLVIFYFVTVKYKQGIAALGISLKNIIKNIAVALYGYLAFLPVLTVIFLAVIFAMRILHYHPPQPPIYELIFKEKRSVLLIIISGMVSFIGPVIEEIFFRGFLYSAVKKNFGYIKSIVITAVIFSALHTSIVSFVPIAALGVFLAYLREKTGSLVPSVCVHIMHNSALAFLMFLARQAIALGAA